MTKVFIFKLTTATQPRGRQKSVEVSFLKIPYGGIYGLLEVVGRALAEGELRWFRLEPANPREIAQHRKTLVRWQEALHVTTEVTGARFDV